MLITKFVRRQLVVFGILTVLAVGLVCSRYLDLPRLLGFGQYEVTMTVTDATGLHKGAFVNYRGVGVGRVKGLEVGPEKVVVRLGLDKGTKIPRDLDVEVHSSSAAGEQFVDLLPSRDAPPWLESGDAIPADRVTPLPSTTDLLDGVSGLAKSLPREDVDTVLTEMVAAFGGRADDWRSLLTSTSAVLEDARDNLDDLTGVVDAADPFLATQQQIAPDIASSFNDLDAVTGTLAGRTAELKALLASSPPALAELTGLLTSVKGDVGALLRDLTSTGQVVKLYLPGIEQVLVIYPAAVAGMQAATGPEGGADPTSVHLALRPNINQPPSCLEGFISLKDQRDFSDEAPRSLIRPDLYCHAPADDPRDVRGARNSPCFNVPGRRAASVEQCLGRPIGSITDPLLPADRRIGSYQVDSRRALTGDGMTFLLDDGPRSGNGGATWQQLFLP